VYSLVDLRLLAHLDTMPTGTKAARGRTCHVGGDLLAVSQAPHNFVLACLGVQRGQVVPFPWHGERLAVRQDKYVYNEKWAVVGGGSGSGTAVPRLFRKVR